MTSIALHTLESDTHIPVRAQIVSRRCACKKSKGFSIEMAFVYRRGCSRTVIDLHSSRAEVGMSGRVDLYSVSS